MKALTHLDQLATLALGGGLGYLLLSQVSAHAHLIAWALVLAGAIVRAATLPAMRKQARKGIS